MTITKIVITGGPCAGKSSAMKWIRNAFSQKGYTVLFVPEAATELIRGGVAPWTCDSQLSFQEFLLSLQMHLEQIFEDAARKMDAARALIVCDRGALDAKAYMTASDFEKQLDDFGVSETELSARYDAVFHLVTAANGVQEFYTTESNAARTETVEEAVNIDNKLFDAWRGHPHLRIIDSASRFEDKMEQLIDEISSFLDEKD